MITEAATAGRMPPGVPARVFKIIADSSLAEIRSYAEQFLPRSAR